MEIQKSIPIKLERTLPLKKLNQSSLPQLDEQYFDKLAAFGLACLAAAIVGKIVLNSLSMRK